MKTFSSLLHLIIACIAIVACTSCANQPKWNTAEGEVIKDLSYGEGPRNRYDLYLPANGKPKALMLFIHGGSWISGEKEDMAWAAKRYTDEGYITASINYTRLGGDELGCNIKQMAIGGYSAGAHLTMLYSTLYATTSPIPIKFQISWVGPSDFNLLFPTPPNFNIVGSAPENESKIFYANMNNFVYGISGKNITTDTTVEQINKLKCQVSPVDLVTPQTPPAVLAYGGQDRLVNAIHGEKMAQELDAAGVKQSLIIFPNSGHGLEADPECTSRVQEVILEYCAEYFGNR